MRRKAIDVGATAWLDDLPELVASLEQEWGITVGDANRDSTEAFVVDATSADGTPAVLKLLVPGCSARRSASSRSAGKCSPSRIEWPSNREIA